MKEVILLMSFITLACSEWTSTAKLNTTWTGSSLNHTASSHYMVNFLTIGAAQDSNATISCGFLCKDQNRCLFSVFVFPNRQKKNLIVEEQETRVLWAANRHRFVSRNASVVLSSKGLLSLHDYDGSTIWTGAGNSHVVAIALSNSSNLMLLDSSDNAVWQSFHSPGAVLVRGQNFTGALVADDNPDTFTKGSCNIRLQKDELVLYSDASRQHRYWTHSLIGDALALTYFNKFFVSESFSYLQLQQNGNIQVQSLVEHKWVVTYDFYSSSGISCVSAGQCGAYELCIDNHCKCPEISSAVGTLVEDSFSFINNSKPELGCKAMIPLSNEGQQHMIQMKNITYFAPDYRDKFNTESLSSDAATVDRIDRIEGNITEIDCKMNCLDKSYCRFSIHFDRGHGEKSLCYLLNRVSLQSSYNISSTAFIKMQNVNYSLPSIHKSIVHQRRSKAMNTWLLLVITCSSLLVIFFIVVISFIIRRRNMKDYCNTNPLESLPSFPKYFTYRQLQVCTKNFSRILGKGGSGTVYYGEISSGLLVAVKRLEDVKKGEKQFEAEVRTIGSINHLNLVKLLGFCAEFEHRLLVYEFMPNRSLDHWIFSGDNKILEWDTRFHISVGIAKGLAYLHDECQDRIIHLDIKPQNILLDKHWLAKVSDFGLSKLMNRDDESAIMTTIRGTPGYLAPEWLHSRVTEKADVYSFGILLLEIVSGRRCIDYECADKKKSYLPAWINSHIIKESVNTVEVIDGRLKGVFDSEQAKRAVIVGLWCIQNDANVRPSMSSVVEMLKGIGHVENPPVVHSNTLSTAFCEFVESLSV